MNRLRQYRFLMIVCGLAILAGIWEVTHDSQDGKSARKSSTGSPNADELPLDRRVFSDIYRDSSNAEFDLGLEAYNRRDYEVAADCFARALSSGVKTNQDLLWYQILVLMHLNKDEVEISRAIATWRRNFPHSDKYSAPYWSFAVELLQTNASAEASDAAVARWSRQSDERDMPDPYWTVAARLTQSGAPANEIDAAVSRWRRMSPQSDLPDPRQIAPPRPSQPKRDYRN